ELFSASRRISTICSSVNRLFLIGSSFSMKSHLSRNYWSEELGQVTGAGGAAAERRAGGMSPLAARRAAGLHGGLEPQPPGSSLAGRTQRPVAEGSAGIAGALASRAVAEAGAIAAPATGACTTSRRSVLSLRRPGIKILSIRTVSEASHGRLQYCRPRSRSHRPCSKAASAPTFADRRT